MISPVPGIFDYTHTDITTILYHIRIKNGVPSVIKLSHLGYCGMFINGHKYFVEQYLKVVTENPVHDEPFQRGHWNSNIVSVLSGSQTIKQ